MKKIYLLLFLATLLAGCKGDQLPQMDDISTGEVAITLTGLDGQAAGFTVQLRNMQTNSIFTAQTNAEGTAVFRTTPGLYEASATGGYASEGVAYNFNGTSGQITVRTNQTQRVTITMKSIRTSQLVIKELYSGGCLADDGTTKMQCDKYIVLYNNSAQPASLSNLCFGFLTPYNAQANNNNYNAQGQLTYEAEGITPVLDGIWYFPATLDVAPYAQVVVNIHGAIDNTQAYSQSVNFAHEEYYCMYDPESGYNNTRYYPTPSAVIPSSHYLRAYRWSMSNAWPLSVASPAMLVFQTHDSSPALYAANMDNAWYDGGEVRQTKQCMKVPNDWIVDAIEVFASGYKDSSKKRLTADIDAGYVWFTNYQGHSLYRNVNQSATEALPENEGRLVYGYSLGVDGTTDPSGIDAEASIRQGAHIVYQDTNNSTNDFHERQICGLRPK